MYVFLCNFKYIYVILFTFLEFNPILNPVFIYYYVQWPFILNWYLVNYYTLLRSNMISYVLWHALYMLLPTVLDVYLVLYTNMYFSSHCAFKFHTLLTLFHSKLSELHCGNGVWKYNFLIFINCMFSSELFRRNFWRSFFSPVGMVSSSGHCMEGRDPLTTHLMLYNTMYNCNCTQQLYTIL